MSCTLQRCAADHQHGDLACAVDTAIPVAAPTFDRESVVLLTAVCNTGGNYVDIDLGGRPARVRLGDLLDAVAATAAAFLPAVTVR